MNESQPQGSWLGRNLLWILPVGCMLPLCMCGGLFVSIFFVAASAIQSSDVYTDSLARAGKDSEVQEKLGLPLTPGYPFQGNIQINNDSGDADFSYPVTGPKGSGTIHVKAERWNGEWEYSQIDVVFDADQQKVSLLLDVPTEDDLKKLVTATMDDFRGALRTADFTKFQANTAKKYQEQFTAEQLKQNFKVFLDRNLQLNEIESVELVFDQPPYLENEQLLVEGVYPLRPVEVQFDLTYIREKDAWKLFGINIKFQPVNVAGEIPNDDTIKKMVKTSLDSFSQAVSTKDFSLFHQETSTVFQRRFDNDKLKEVFKQFLENTEITKQVPALDPEIGEKRLPNDGVLSIKGTYPTTPEVIKFEVDYLYELEAWRLAGINVKVISPMEKPAEKDAKPE